jgi:RND family efflux transporter MFP subunit
LAAPGLLALALVAGGLASAPADAPGSGPGSGTGSGTGPGLSERAAHALGAGDWDAIAERFGGYKADTKPSRDATMQFSLSTEVKDVLVVGGQRVRRGDVLLRARDAEIVAARERQRIIAESTNEVDNAVKQLELARFKFERLKEGGTFSQSEFEELRIQAEAAALQLEQARVNQRTQQVALKQIEGQAERFFLEAPFDGVIEEVMVEVGQGVTEQEKILRIVNTDRLWLDAYAATAETLRLGLKTDAPAWALVQLADAPRLVRGRVLYVSPVADSVSQTRRVRVEIENPDSWPAGTLAKVRFTQPGPEWDAYGPAKAPGAGQVSAATGVRPAEAAP